MNHTRLFLFLIVFLFTYCKNTDQDDSDSDDFYFDSIINKEIHKNTKSGDSNSQIDKNISSQNKKDPKKKNSNFKIDSVNKNKLDEPITKSESQTQTLKDFDFKPLKNKNKIQKNSLKLNTKNSIKNLKNSYPINSINNKSSNSDNSKTPKVREGVLPINDTKNIDSPTQIQDILSNIFKNFGENNNDSIHNDKINSDKTKYNKDNIKKQKKEPKANLSSKKKSKINTQSDKTNNSWIIQIVKKINKNPLILLNFDYLKKIKKDIEILKNQENIKLQLKKFISKKLETILWEDKFNVLLQNEILIYILDLTNGFNKKIKKNIIKDFKNYLLKLHFTLYFKSNIKNNLYVLKAYKKDFFTILIKVYEAVGSIVISKNFHNIKFDKLISEEFQQYILQNYLELKDKYYEFILKKLKEYSSSYKEVELFKYIEFLIYIRTKIVKFGDFPLSDFDNELLKNLDPKKLVKCDSYLQNLKILYEKYKEVLSSNILKNHFNDLIKSLEEYQEEQIKKEMLEKLNTTENLFDIFNFSYIYHKYMKNINDKIVIRIEYILSQNCNNVFQEYLDIINKENNYNRIDLHEDSPYFYIFKIFEKILLEKNFCKNFFQNLSIQELKDYSYLLTRDYCSEDIKSIYKDIFSDKYSQFRMTIPSIIKKLVSLYQNGEYGPQDVEYIILKKLLIQNKEALKKYLLNQNIDYGKSMEYLRVIFENDKEFIDFLKDIDKEKNDSIDSNNNVKYNFNNFIKKYLNSEALSKQLENILIAYDTLHSYKFDDQQYILRTFNRAKNALKNKYRFLFNKIEEFTISEKELLNISKNLNLIDAKSKTEREIINKALQMIRDKLGEDFYYSLQEEYLKMNKNEFLMFGLSNNKKYYDNFLKEFIDLNEFEKDSKLHFDQNIYEKVLNLKKNEFFYKENITNILTIKKAMSLLRNEILYEYIKSNLDFVLSKKSQSPFLEFIENTWAPRFGINLKGESLFTKYEKDYFLYTFDKNMKSFKNAKKSDTDFGLEDIRNLINISSDLFKRHFGYLKNPEVYQEIDNIVKSIEKIVNHTLDHIKNWKYFFIPSEQQYSFFKNNYFEFLACLHIFLEQIDEKLGNKFLDMVFSNMSKKLFDIYYKDVFLCYGNNKNISMLNYIDKGVYYMKTEKGKKYETIDPYELKDSYCAMYIDDKKYQACKIKHLDPNRFTSKNFSSNFKYMFMEYIKGKYKKHKKKLYNEYEYSHSDQNQYYDREREQKEEPKQNSYYNNRYNNNFRPNNKYLTKNGNSWKPTKELSKITRNLIRQIKDFEGLKDLILDAELKYTESNIFSISFVLNEKLSLEGCKRMKNIITQFAERIIYINNNESFQIRKNYIEFLISKINYGKNTVIKLMLEAVLNPIIKEKDEPFDNRELYLYLNKNLKKKNKEIVNDIYNQKVFDLNL